MNEDNETTILVSNVDAAVAPQEVAALLAHVAPVVALARTGSSSGSGDDARCVFRATFESAAAARAALLLTACPLGRSTVVVTPSTEGVPPQPQVGALQATAAAALWAAAGAHARAQNSAERAASVVVGVRGATLTAADVRDTLEPCGAIAHCTPASAAAFIVQFRDRAAVLATATYHGACVRGATLTFVSSFCSFMHTHATTPSRFC